MSSLLLLKRSLLTPLRVSVAEAATRRFLATTGSGKKKGSSNTPRKAYVDEPDDSRDNTTDIIIRSLDAPIIYPPPPSEEEAKRRLAIGRAFNIGVMEMHNDREHDLSCKIKIKLHAIDMLPRNSILKEKALETDFEGPPMWRPIPKMYPPIENFDPRVLTGEMTEEYEHSDNKD